MGWLKRQGQVPDETSEDFGAEFVHDGQKYRVITGRHASVIRADLYSFQVAHRRLAWLFRLSVATNIALVCLAVILGNGIVEIAPLIGKTELALLRADPKDNRLYRIEPLSKDVDGFALVLEDKARRYVRNILEIDSVTQTERFREAFRMTDRAFYEKFRKERIDTREVQNAIDSGLTRSITVESVDRINAFGNTYKYAVDFIQTDVRRGEVVETRRLRAYLNMTTRKQENVSEADKYENPLGITVLDMALKERGNS
ncbi:MAG: hypothetical protein HQL35_09080 [Alphaproteobacteria bacterium]|nr:hypothetical protein [Alphaproteobacteria bacterium]